MQAPGREERTRLAEQGDGPADVDGLARPQSERGAAVIQPVLILMSVAILVVLLWQSFGLRADIAAQTERITALETAQATQMQTLIDRIQTLQTQNATDLAGLQETFAGRYGALEAQAADRFAAFERTVDRRVGRLRDQAEAAQAAVESLKGDVAEIAARQDQLNTVTLALQKSLAEIAERLDRYAPGPAPSNFEFWRAVPGGGEAVIVITAYGTEAAAAVEIARLALALRGAGPAADKAMQAAAPAPISVRPALPGEYLPVLKGLSAQGDAPASLMVAHTYGYGGAADAERAEALSFLGAALLQLRFTRFDVVAFGDGSNTRGAAGRSAALRTLAGEQPQAGKGLLSIDPGLLKRYFGIGVGTGGGSAVRSLFGADAAVADTEDGERPMAALQFGVAGAEGATASGVGSRGFDEREATAIARAVRAQMQDHVTLAEESLALAARLLPEKDRWILALRRRVDEVRRSSRAVLAGGDSGLGLFCASVLQDAQTGSGIGSVTESRCRSMQRSLESQEGVRRFYRDVAALEGALHDFGGQLAEAPPGGLGGPRLSVGPTGPT